MNEISLQACQWCGCIHQNTLCPRVRAIDHYPDGTVKRVEFWESPKVTQLVVDVGDVKRLIGQ